jgi:hypothetical protein
MSCSAKWCAWPAFSINASMTLSLSSTGSRVNSTLGFRIIDCNKDRSEALPLSFSSIAIC